MRWKAMKMEKWKTGKEKKKKEKATAKGEASAMATSAKAMEAMATGGRDMEVMATERRDMEAMDAADMGATERGEDMDTGASTDMERSIKWSRWRQSWPET